MYVFDLCYMTYLYSIHLNVPLGCLSIMFFPVLYTTPFLGGQPVEVRLSRHHPGGGLHRGRNAKSPGFGACAEQGVFTDPCVVPWAQMLRSKEKGG